MRRLIPALVLAALFMALPSSAFAVASTTTYDLTASDNTAVNKVQTAITVNSTENIVVIQIGTKSRTLTFVSTSAWYYRSSAGGANFPVAANQTLTLKFTTTSTFYHVRQSADGTMNVLCTE